MKSKEPTPKEPEKRSAATQTYFFPEHCLSIQAKSEKEARKLLKARLSEINNQETAK